MIQAAAADCGRCIELLIPSLDKVALGRAALAILPPNDDGDELAMLLDAGADVNAVDRQGRSVLMRTAASDTVPPALVQRLLSSGADVQAKGRNGETALAFASPRGNTPTRNALAAAAGVPATAAAPASAPSPATASPAASPRDAVIRALPILQQTGVTFRRKAGCVSCHNNTLTARVTAEASRAGIPIDEAVARSEVKGIAQFLETWRERALQGLGIPGDADTVSYIMLGLADEKHPPDPATDAMARFLKRRQLADGSWRTVAHRPPIESTDITVTALSLRALQVYAPAPMRAAYEDAARAGGRWLAAQTPRNTEERASQLLGMKWAGQGADAHRPRDRAPDRGSAAGWRLVAAAHPRERRLRHRPGPGGAARRGWRADDRPCVSARGRVPAAHPARRRHVARRLAGARHSAALRHRLSPRQRFVDLGRRHQLGRDGPGPVSPRTTMITRRDFVKTTTASLAAATALPARATAEPARSAEILIQRTVRPVVISDYSGFEFTNGGPENAVQRAFRLITEGQDVLDALIAGVNIPELDPLETGIGYGALPNANGVVELDASCMHGPTKRAGAVACIEGVRTPSLVAKAVMDNTDHHLLVGAGAQAFARAMGFKVEEDLNTETSRRLWLEWKRRVDPEHWLDPKGEGRKPKDRHEKDPGHADARRSPPRRSGLTWCVMPRGSRARWRPGARWSVTG